MPYVTRKVPGTTEITGLDGERKTVPTGRTVKAQVWAPPEDTREKELVRHGRVIKALTVLCLALSVVAVGGLLTAMLPAWAAYGVGGGLFDLFWLVALYTEHLADTRKRVKQAAQGVGLVFMAASATAIVMDGVRLHVAALGCLLAVIPLGIKGFWWMRFSLVQPPMSAEQQFELEHNLGELAVQTRQAEAQLYAKAKLARLAELLEAAEPEAIDWSELEQLASVASTAREQIANTPSIPEHAREHGEQVPSTTAVSSANTARPVFGFASSLAEQVREQFASSASNAEITAAVLAANPGANAASVAAQVRRHRARAQKEN